MTADLCPVSILMAEDDDDDYLLTQKAIHKSAVGIDLIRVKNGEELMDYLLQRDASGPPQALPGLVLLDLNMPRVDGREALRVLRAHPHLKAIPVVIFTTSRDAEDVRQSYRHGASSFIHKPTTFQELIRVVTVLCHYWLGTVELPLKAAP